MAAARCQSVALAITGASGAPYGLRLLECLLGQGVEVHLMLSRPGQLVIGMETDVKLPARPAQMRRFLAEHYGAAEGQLHLYDREQWTAPVASGSAAPDAMVICPCTTATLSAVATGASRSLIERAADVVLKERRRLIMVVRETPLSEIHLENMLRLARMGAVMMPANPGFYHRPTGIDGLVDFMVARVLDHLGLEQDLVARWGEDVPDDD
ncbi:MAG TPA: UbiX family flavin prenyltransferase [Thioalkalivibrio sp.]|nr:UbiX family flavin prenyltransferase [Thioalkalivibrio sp.]